MKLFRNSVVVLMFVAMITLLASLFYSDGTLTYFANGHYGVHSKSGWPKLHKHENHIKITDDPPTYRVANECIYGNGLRLKLDSDQMLVIYEPLPEDDADHMFTCGINLQDFPIFVFKDHSNYGLIGIGPGNFITRRATDGYLLFPKMPLIAE